jgi:hypothetical protein
VAFLVLRFNNRSEVQGSASSLTAEIAGLVEEEILEMKFWWFRR